MCHTQGVWELCGVHVSKVHGVHVRLVLEQMCFLHFNMVLDLEVL